MTDALIAALTAAGLDLVRGFDVAAYNATAVAGLALPDFGRAHAHALVVANTRALWPRFLDACRADRALVDAPDPLDRYVETALAAAAACCPLATTIRFGHVATDTGFWPLQQIAAIAGLGRLAPSHLLVHAEHGPWIALRAVIVVDADAMPQPPAAVVPPCECARACEVALVHAQRARGDDAWRAWLAVRDACPIGAASRYDDAQLRYHYTKDPAVLFRALHPRDR